MRIMQNVLKYLLIVTIFNAVFFHDFTSLANPGSDRIWHVSGGVRFAYHQYYDVPAWNSNGSRLLLRSSKAGSVFLNGGLDRTPESLKLPATPVGYIQWDRIRPEIFYYTAYDKKSQTLIYSYNLASRESRLLFKAPTGLQLAPCHPDGDHLLLYPGRGGARIAEIFSLSTKKVLNVPLPAKIHLVRFTKHEDLSIFCNQRGGITGREHANWILDSMTGAAREIPIGYGMQFDWQPGGNLLSFCETDDVLEVVNRKGESVRSFPGVSGCQSWSDDGKKIVVAVLNKKSRFSGEIIICDPFSGEIAVVTPHQAHTTQRQSSHPQPVFSPDRTKVVFNSNYFGKQNPQVYVVQVKPVEPVKNLRLNSQKGSFELSWSVPSAKEVKCIVIYKILTDSRRVKVADLDARQVKYAMKAEEGIKGFEVVAKEFSGLESEPVTTDLSAARSGSWLDNLF
jgi:hypothetical protein